MEMMQEEIGGDRIETAKSGLSIQSKTSATTGSTRHPSDPKSASTVGVMRSA